MEGGAVRIAVIIYDVYTKGGPSMNNEKQFIEDPRFHVCFREMILCYLFFAAFFALVMVTMYGLGNQLVLGLPL